MLYMQSQANSDGNLTITVNFKLGIDPDKAEQLVQNRVSQALPRLPEDVQRLGITTFGMVDTNSDPNKVDFAIPANDDATKSIAIITNYIVAAIAEGLAERQASKDEDETDDSNNENEARARRLEAEAQSEAGRGGRGRGAGAPAGGPGGAPKRRTPAGGGNRRPAGGGGR